MIAITVNIKIVMLVVVLICVMIHAPFPKESAHVWLASGPPTDRQTWFRRILKHGACQFFFDGVSGDFTITYVSEMKKRVFGDLVKVVI